MNNHSYLLHQPCLRKYPSPGSSGLIDPDGDFFSLSLFILHQAQIVDF